MYTAGWELLRTNRIVRAFSKLQKLKPAEYGKVIAAGAKAAATAVGYGYGCTASPFYQRTWHAPCNVG